MKGMMVFEETEKKIIMIKKTAVSFRTKVKKNIKKEIIDNDLEEWHKDVLEIAEKLINKKGSEHKKEYLELLHNRKEYVAYNKFKDKIIIDPSRFKDHIGKIRKYLNILLNYFDDMYPIIFERYFNKKYNKVNFIMESERIIK